MLTRVRSAVAWLDEHAWAKWSFVVAVLTISLAAGAWRGADWLMHPQPGKPDITLDATIDEWIEATRGGDAACYLEAARNYAAHRGITCRVPDSNPTIYAPFYFWGPGTPWALGQWLRHTGGQTMWACFWFNVTCCALFGVIALATAALYTRRAAPLALTAFLAGFSLLLESYFFSMTLTCSEIVCLVPLGLMTYALCRAFLLRAANKGRLLTAVWFASAGAWLGLASLARDSAAQFGAFIALFLIAQTLWRNWRQVGWAVAYAAVLLVCVKIPRYKVEQWNLDRIDLPVVSTSSQFAVWRAGLWAKHDQERWYVISGMGFGEYLDPTGPARVEAYYESKEPWPEWYSFKQLMAGVWQHPLEALEFKLARVPVLWLGTFEWPNCVLYDVSAWCIGTYALFFAYLFVRIRARRPVPEPLYLFPLFLACAMPLIHFEGRYSFPAWHMLVILPALWSAHRAEIAAAKAAPEVESSGGAGAQPVPQRLAA